MTRAERKAELQAELAQITAEEEAERGLVEGEKCWVALPTKGTVAEGIYFPQCNLFQFPFTDDGKRKADRAALLMSSLNFEDPPFEQGQEVRFLDVDGRVTYRGWRDTPVFHDAWHQGRIHATESEALAWRDKFNGAWTGGGK